MILVLSVNDLLSLKQTYLYFMPDKFLILAKLFYFLPDVIKYQIFKVWRMGSAASIHFRAASLNFSYLRCSNLFILVEPQGLKDGDKRGHSIQAWAYPTIRPCPGLDTVPRMGLVLREVMPRVLVCVQEDAHIGPNPDICQQTDGCKVIRPRWPDITTISDVAKTRNWQGHHDWQIFANWCGPLLCLFSLSRVVME